jgi:hypothetical protein
MPSYKYKYLFRAFYSNGDVHAQDQDDESVLHPGQSMFADIDHPRLSAFALESLDKVVGLDLLSGIITIHDKHGRWLMPDATRASEQVVTPKRLIYFRRVNWELMHTEDGVLAPYVQYHIGWQANDADGKNVQRVEWFD